MSGIVMEDPYLSTIASRCGFPWGAPVSFHSSKACTKCWLVTLNWTHRLWLKVCFCDSMCPVVCWRLPSVGLCPIPRPRKRLRKMNEWKNTCRQVCDSLLVIPGFLEQPVPLIQKSYLNKVFEITFKWLKINICSCTSYISSKELHQPNVIIFHFGYNHYRKYIFKCAIL